MRWKYRGIGWEAPSETISANYKDGNWHIARAFGSILHHYLEAIPIKPKPQVWTFESKGWQEINNLRKQIKDLTTMHFYQRDQINELEARLNEALCLLNSIAEIAEQREL